MGKDNRFTISLDMTEVWSGLDKFESRLAGISKVKAGLPSGIKDSISAMEQQVASLKDEIKQLGTGQQSASNFTSFSTQIVKDMAAMQEQSKKLEAEVQAVMETLAGGDATALKGWMRGVKAEMGSLNDTANAVSKTMQSVYVASNGKADIHIMNEASLKRDKQQLLDIGNQLRSVENMSRQPVRIDFKGVKDANAQLDEVVTSAEKAREALSGMKYNDDGYFEAAKKYADAVAKAYDIGEAARGQYGEDRLDKSIIRRYGNVTDVKKSIQSIRAEIQSVNRLINKQASEVVEEQQPKANQVNIPIEIEADASALTKTVKGVIKALQSTVDKNPLEVAFTLVSKHKYSKFEDALQKFQEQINKIEDDKAREDMQTIANDLSAGFGKEIVVALKSSIQDAEYEINKIIDGIRENLKKPDKRIVVNPKIEFDEEELDAFRSQVEDVATSLNSVITKAARKSFSGGKKTDKDGNEVYTGQLGKLYKGIGGFLKDAQNANGALEQIANYKIPESQDFGAGKAKELANSLNEAASALKLIMGAGGKAAGKTLFDVLEGFDFADNIIKNSKNKKDNPVRERMVFIGSDNKIYGDYLYGEERTASNYHDAMDNLPNGVKPRIALHTHPNARFVVPSFRNLMKDENGKSVARGNGDIKGDLFAWQTDFAKGVKYTVTKALDEISVLDTNFYKDLKAKGISLGDQEIKKTIEKSSNGFFSTLKSHPYIGATAIAKKAGNRNYLEDVRGIINAAGGGELDVEKFKKSFERNAFTKGKDDADAILFNAISDAVSSQNADFKKQLADAIDNYSVSDAYREADTGALIIERDNSINKLFGLDRIPEGEKYRILENAFLPSILSGKFIPKDLKSDYKDTRAVGDLFAKYYRTYSKEQFRSQNPLNIQDNVPDSPFKTEGLDSFAKSLSGISTSIQPLVDALNNIPKDGINIKVDDGIIQKIHSITQSIHELLDVLLEMSTVSYDTGAFEDLIFGGKPSSNDIANRLKNTLQNKNAYQIAMNAGKSLDATSDTYYHDWAQAIVRDMEKAGLSIDEIVTKTRTLNTGIVQNDPIDLNIDTSKLEAAGRNINTLKSSVNSFRKEFKNLVPSELDVELLAIVGALSELKDAIPSELSVELLAVVGALTEMLDVLQRFTGVHSVGTLAKEFEDIQVMATGFGKQSLAKKHPENRARADEILKKYQEYVSHGGEASIADIGGAKNLQKYLSDNYKASLEAANAEADALTGIQPAATGAADAKRDFAQANQTLFDSIIQSIDGLNNEGKAFESLNKLINNLGGKNGLVKMATAAASIELVTNALNQPISKDSFLTSLEKFVGSGGSLKDLAEIVRRPAKAEKTRKKQAEDAARIARQQVSSDILSNKDQETFANARAAISAGNKETIYLDLRVNREGFIEAEGYVKDLNNELRVVKMQSEDGVNFNTTGISSGTKKAETLARFLEKINGQMPNATDEITFDKNSNPEVWQQMINHAREYRDEIGELVKVTRQVRQPGGPGTALYESFSFFGDKGGHVTFGRNLGDVASSQELSNPEKIAKLYEGLTKNRAEYYELSAKRTDGSATNLEIERLKTLENEYSSLASALREVNNELGENNVGQKAYIESLVGGNLEYDKRLDKYTSSAQERFNKAMAGGLTTDMQMQVSQAMEAVTRIDQIRAKYQQDPMRLWDNDDLAETHRLTQQIDDTLSRVRDKDSKAATTAQVDKLLQRAYADINNNSLDSGLSNRYKDIIARLEEVRQQAKNTQNGLADIDKVEYARFAGQLEELRAEMRRTGQEGKGFWKQFSQGITSQSAQFLARYFSLQDIIRYAREAVQIVTQVDTSLKELQKVSGSTDQQMSTAFDHAAANAQKYGATITDVIDSTADWSRLGYSMPEAEELARVTTMYQNIAKGIDQSSASEYMVSTLQGFQLQASQAEGIIDSINEVANNFAIDQAGIGEALERSAASLNAANTDLNKSIALVTTGNAVLQNPESVGTAFKTLSARLRGASAELQELGEDEAEVTETTSNLRKEVLALTGFDIMTDKNTYKDVYDILLGIGKAWDNLTDVQQAALAEDLAGKRMASVLYAVLGNTDKLEAAYATALDSSGSAQKAQEIYASSVESSIKTAKASLQELASDFMDSKLLKGIIDMGNGIINVLDNIVEHIGMVGTALIGLGAGNTIKGLLTPQKGSFVTNGIKDIAQSISEGRTNKGLVSDLQGAVRTARWEEFTAPFQMQKRLEELQKVTPDAVMSDVVFDPFADVVGQLKSAGSLEKAASLLKSLPEDTLDAEEATRMLMDAYQATDKEAKNALKSAQALPRGISVGMVAATTAISVGIIALQAYMQHLENLRKQAREASETWAQSNDAMHGNYEQVVELRKQLDSGTLAEEEQYKVKEQIYEIQKQITEQYGEAAEGVNLINGELSSELELLRHISQEEALRDLRENRAAYAQAEKDSLPTYYELGGNFTGRAAEDVQNLIRNLEGFSKTSGYDESDLFQVGLEVDAEHAIDAINDYIDGLEALREANADDKAYTRAIDSAIKQATNLLGRKSEFWTSTAEVMRRRTEEELVAAGGGTLFAQLEDAAEEYNKTLFTGDTDAVYEARDAFEEARDAMDEFFTLKGIDRGAYSDLLQEVNDGIDSTAEKVFNATQEINEAMETVSFMSGGNVDLFNRPNVSAQTMRGAYPDFADGYATVYSTTVANQAGTIAANFTPIMTDENGKYLGVLNADQLEEYASAVISGVQTDTLNLQIGSIFTGEDAIAHAEEAAERIHELQAEMYPEDFVGPMPQGDIRKDTRMLGKSLQDIINKGVDKVDVRNVLTRKISEAEVPFRAALTELARQFDFDISDNSQLESFIDLLYQTGVISGDASDAIKESANAYTTLKTEINKAIESIEKVNAALSESASGAGLSEDSLVALRALYGDDLNAALETTANGYHLNVREMAKLERQQEELKKADFANSLAEQYAKLEDAQINLEEAYRSGNYQDAAQWSATIESINEEITKTQDLAMEWVAATSAYQDYVNAKSQTKDRSMYETIAKDYKSMKEQSQIWTTDPEVMEYAHLVTGQMITDAEDVNAAFENMEKKIGNTGVAVKDFYTLNDDGDITPDGLKTFLDTVYDVQDAMGGEWVQKLEDGSYTFDFGDQGDVAFLQALKDTFGVDFGFDAMQSLLRALSEVGFAVDLNAEMGLDALRKNAEGAVEALNNLGSTDLSGINLNPTSFEEASTAIASVQEYIQRIRESEDLTPEIKTDRLKYANQIMEYLIQAEAQLTKEVPLNVTLENLDKQIAEAEKNLKDLSDTDGEVSITLDDEAAQNLEMLYQMRASLDQPAVMSVDASQIGGSLGNAVAMIQQFQGAITQLQVLQELAAQGVDVSANVGEVETQIQTLAGELAGLKQEDLVTLGIDQETWNAQLAAIAETPIDVNTKLDEGSLGEITKEIESIKPADIKAKVVADTKELDEANSKLNQMNGKNVLSQVTVEIRNKASFIDIYNKWKEMKNGAVVMGTASSSGSSDYRNSNHTTKLYGSAAATGSAMSAFAHGDWGIPDDTDALINELGPEIIVRDGQWFTVNRGYPTFASLQKGDVIFNHRQSEEILKHGHISGSHARMIGGAFAHGTAFAGSSGSGKFPSGVTTTKKKTTGTGNSNSGKSAADKASKEVKDWVEVRLQNIAASLERFKTMADYYVTFTYQNRELNKAIQQAKTNTAQNEAAYNKYIKKANSIKLSSNLKKLVREGDINIKSYDDKTQQLISEYSEWYSKAQECKNTIIELKKEQLDLSRQKLDNIIDDYEAVNNYLSATYDNWMKLNELAEKKQGVGNVEYLKNAAAYQNSTIKELRQAEKELTAEMNRQLKSGAMVKGSQEWEEAMTDIRDVQNAIKDAELEIYNLNEAIREVNWSGWNRIIARLEHYDSQLDTTIGLISDLTAYNKDASITDAGLSAMNMNALGLKYARLEIEDYTYAMETLRKELANGTINQEQFNEQLFDYAEKQMSAVEEAKKYREAIISLVKDGIDAETAAMENLIDTRKEALEKQKEADDYAKRVNDQTKEINKIRAQIAALSGDTTLAAQAKVAKLRADLADKEADLEETRRDHTYDTMIQGYDDELEKFKEIQDEKIEALSYSLANQETVISNVLDETMDQYRKTAEILNQIAMEYGIKLEGFIVDPWDKATSAAQVYKQAIAGLETSQNETGDTNIITAGAVNVRSEGTDITTGNMVNVSSATDTVKLKESITSPFYTKKKAARGAKNARGLYLTDEQGLGSEALITKDGVLRQLDSDTVFSKKQTDVLWDLSKMPLNSMLNNASKIVRADTSVNMHYDSMLTVNGNVDRDALPGLQDLLKQACEYTKQDISATFSKMGLRGVL